MAGLRTRLRGTFATVGGALSAFVLVFLPAFHTCDPFHGSGPGADRDAPSRVETSHDHDGHVDGPDTCPACQIHSGGAEMPLPVLTAARPEVLVDRPPAADALPRACDVLVPPARAPPA